MFATRFFFQLLFVNLIDVFTSVTSVSVYDDIQQLHSQINNLISQKQNDHDRMETILRDSLDKDTEIQQLRNEIRDLSVEVNSMKMKSQVGNRVKNEQLTVKWLANSIAEIRAEIAEIVKSLNSTAELQQRQTFSTDISILQNDVVSLRHDIESLKADATKYNAKLSVISQDVDALKQLDSATSAKITNFAEQMKGFASDWTRFLKKLHKHRRRVFKRMIVANENPLEMKVFTLPGEIGPAKRKQHVRLYDDTPTLSLHHTRSTSNKRWLDEQPRQHQHQHQHQHQTSGIETGQRQKVDEIDSTMLSDLEKRTNKLEAFCLEVNLRLKGQEKLHSSMLELLESVENIEAKFDSVTPDLKKEISKLEFTFSQIAFNTTILLENQVNHEKTIKLISENLSATRTKLDNMTLTDTKVNKILSLCDVSTVYNNFTSLLTWHKNVSNNELEERDEVKNPICVVGKMMQELQSFYDQYMKISQKLPRDCSDIEGVSGIYLISPDGYTPISVFCEISNQLDSFTYTVIQRRINGMVDFNKSWEEYAKGFGNLLGEFWLGNEILHRLTKNNDTMAEIQFQDSSGRSWYARYDEFNVASRQDGFRLAVDSFSGNTTNALEYQNHMKFSTRDSDHDTSDTNCAANYEGGWWFSHCQHTNLNGKYNFGMTWFHSVTNEWIDVVSSKIMLARRKR